MIEEQLHLYKELGILYLIHDNIYMYYDSLWHHLSIILYIEGKLLYTERLVFICAHQRIY